MALHHANRHTVWMRELLSELGFNDVISDKEAVDEGLVKVQWIDTTENLADVMTKSVPRQVLEKVPSKLKGHEKL